MLFWFLPLTSADSHCQFLSENLSLRWVFQSIILTSWYTLIQCFKHQTVKSKKQKSNHQGRSHFAKILGTFSDKIVISIIKISFKVNVKYAERKMGEGFISFGCNLSTQVCTYILNILVLCPHFVSVQPLLLSTWSKPRRKFIKVRQWTHLKSNCEYNLLKYSLTRRSIASPQRFFGVRLSHIYNPKRRLWGG